MSLTKTLTVESPAPADPSVPEEELELPSGKIITPMGFPDGFDREKLKAAIEVIKDGKTLNSRCVAFDFRNLSAGSENCLVPANLRLSRSEFSENCSLFGCFLLV